MEELTLSKIKDTIKDINFEEDFKPYKDLGDGLYELPGCIITNEKGLNEYLNGLRKEIQRGIRESTSVIGLSNN